MSPRVHTAALWAPARESRATRRARRQAARDLTTQVTTASGRTCSPGAAGRAQYLPRAGETGRAALRSPIGLRVPRHQDTSASWQAAYPFLADAGPGTGGVFVGQTLPSGSSFTFDPWVLYQQGRITAPNLVLAGIVGAGKSALAKSLYLRSLAFGRRVYVPCDPKGEHTPIARAVGGTVIRLGPGLPARLNPLGPGPRPAAASDQEWASQVHARRRTLLGALAETTLGRPLSPTEHTALDTALAGAVHAAGPRGRIPVLPDITSRLLDPGPHQPGDPNDGGGGGDRARLAEDGRLVGHALRRLVAGDLAGLFDGPSTVAFDPGTPMLSVDLSRVAENATAMSVLMTCCSAWMEAALADPAGGQRWVVYDEAWRLMAHPALLRRMDAHWRLARHYGIANLLVFHKLTDLDNVGDAGSAARAIATSLLANAETRVIYRQESDQLGPTAAALGLTDAERARLPQLRLGQGLWKIRGHATLVQHQLHTIEHDLFDSTARMSENS